MASMHELSLLAKRANQRMVALEKQAGALGIGKGAAHHAASSYLKSVGRSRFVESESTIAKMTAAERTRQAERIEQFLSNPLSSTNVQRRASGRMTASESRRERAKYERAVSDGVRVGTFEDYTERRRSDFMRWLTYKNKYGYGGTFAEFEIDIAKAFKGAQERQLSSKTRVRALLENRTDALADGVIEAEKDRRRHAANDAKWIARRIKKYAGASVLGV